jgi:hypothetical protein
MAYRREGASPAAESPPSGEAPAPS